MLAQIQREIAEDPYYQTNFANDGQRFIAWYLRRVILRDDAQTRDDITDGPDDKEIDAVIVDEEEQRIVVIQGKFITTGQVDGGPIQEVLTAWLRIQQLDSLQKNCNERLKKKIEAVRTALDEDYRVEFELLTTGVTQAARADLKGFAEQVSEFDDLSASLHLRAQLTGAGLAPGLSAREPHQDQTRAASSNASLTELKYPGSSIAFGVSASIRA